MKKELKRIFSTLVCLVMLFSLVNVYNVKAEEPTPYEVNGELEGDILINGDTQNTAVMEFNKTDTFKVSGALNVKPIKDLLAQIESSYGANLDPTQIAISNLSTTFESTIELPAGLEFTSATPTTTLNGANGNFEITETKVEGNKLTVKLSLAKEVSTFKDVKDAVTGADDELVVEVDGVKFGANATANTNYTIKGTLSGEFNAIATHTLSGKAFNFIFKWTGKQAQGKEDSENPGETITGTVKYKEEQVPPTPYEVNGELEGDILINGDTQNTKVIEFKKEDKFKVSGALNVKPIKDLLAQIEATYGANIDPTQIAISNLSTTFTAVIELPEGLEFTSATPTATLNGANGNFEITETKVEGNKLTVKLGLAKEVSTFKEVKEAVTGVDDELVVEVDGVKFGANATADTNYTIKGTLSGEFNAIATHTLSGKAFNFIFKWTGKQAQGKEDSENPGETITGTVKYKEEPVIPTEDKLLGGDILINGDTQNTKVIEFKKEDKFKVSGALEVKKIKDLLNSIIENYASINPEDITVENVETTFTAIIELPEGLEFTSATPTATLNGANGNFKIVETKVEGNKLTVKLGLANVPSTFKDVKDAVTGVNDELVVEVDGVKFSANATADTNYTIKGSLVGTFKADATHTLSGSAMNFAFDWEAEQINGKEDYTTPGAKTITGTVKYKNVPVITPNKPVVTVPNTAVNTEVGLFIKTLTLSVAGLYFVLKNKKK